MCEERREDVSSSGLTDELAVLHHLHDSPEIFCALELESRGETEFHLQQRLRKLYPDAVVRAALTLRDLRSKAAVKFSHAHRMWFTPTGLEQATSESVARHKAKRFDGLVWDFCCGIGGDSLALAERCEVRAVDLDPAMCLRTEWNGAAYGVADRISTHTKDVAQIIERDGLLHIDPDRRPGGGVRMRRIEDCSPSLDVVRQFLGEFRGGAIKLSPASNFGGKFDDVEIELISLDGECKEATVWFGDLAGAESFRATSLPSGETIAGDPLSARADIGPPRSFIFDPDPAVVRSGLLDVVAEQLQLARLDDAEEYLTGELPIVSPWVTPFRLLDIVPNNDREIRQACRRFDFASVEIKCRHLAINVERMRRQLPLNGTRPGVLIFARLLGKASVLICERPLRTT